MEKQTKDQLEIITSGFASIVAKENIQFVEKSKYDELQRRIDKAIEKLYAWGEVLDPDFQSEMLSILKDEKVDD